MQHLKEQELDDTIREAIQNKPYLGICLGLQSLMEHSEEDGETACLAIVPGRVVRFDDDMKDSNGDQLKIPHMGWNQVRQSQPHPLWQGIEDLSRFYFVHSYYVKPIENQHSCGHCKYHIDFTAAIARDNIFATQFHPEKSQVNGLKLLSNFINWSV